MADGKGARNAWSCHSKITGIPESPRYADALGAVYEYDSNVVNHARIAVGDLLIVRDAHLVHGYGVVEHIERQPGVKTMERCPRCRSADTSTRKRLAPRHRCNDCGHQFDEPDRVPMEVTVYRASYGTWWFSFGSPAPVRALEPVYAGRDRQNAIRRLDLEEALALIRFQADVEAQFHVELLAAGRPISGGHVEAVVRRRIGQQQFRERLLQRYEASCALTGRQPEAVLDAAHLYTYADRPVHEEEGGLLLRADVHRLFDRLLLTFDPSTWRSRVAPSLLVRHETLRVLHDREIAIPAPVRPDLALVAAHHDACRARWRDIA